MSSTVDSIITEVFYGDARDDLLASSADKQSNALSHFSYFLEAYCTQIGVATVEAPSIPYHGIPLQTSKKAISEFWDKLIGAFFTYMGTSAMCYLNPSGRRLSYQSATQYCSSVKVYFTNKFRNEEPIPVFQPEQWKKLREKLRGKYREGNRASGKRMTEGKASSTREDREAMATGCIWLGTAESAEFWHLLNTSYHCSGRGSEVSLVTAEGTTVIEVNEDVYQYQILQADVQRQKNGPFQSVPIYPHRDGILEDFYFSLIYLVVMAGCGNNYIFPTFSDAALKTKSDKSDSKVASLWTNLFDDLRGTFESLSSVINEKLSSHCNKKGSNQVMAESPSVSGLAQIFRTGWELRGCDTLFEYICGSFVMSQQASKAVSKWTAKIGDLIVGGQPPTFNDIGSHGSTHLSNSQESLPNSQDSSGPVAIPPSDGNREKLQHFTDALFEEDVENRWSSKVRELLVMALFLRYEQFCDILRDPNHPEAVIPEALEHYDPVIHNLKRSYNYTSIRNHLFICRIEQALEKIGVDKLIFDQWTSCARNAFLSRNIPGIPIEKLSLYGGKRNDIRMDPRCFVDHFNALASITQSTHVIVQNLHHQLNDVTEILGYERATNTMNDKMIYDMACSIRRLENHLMGEASKPRPVPKGVIRFSITSKGLTNRMSAAEVTTAFFADDYPTGFCLDKESESWRDLHQSERKRLRNHFAVIKRAVRMILMHAEDYPTEHTPQQYKEDVRKIATAAEERIRKALAFDNKTITIYKLTNHPKTKALEKTLNLPDNTPAAMRKFFGSD